MNLSDFAAAMEATWPPQALHRAGPWAVRQGAGGGKRVSAASPVGDWRADDIVLAEQAQAGLGQDSLFVIWPWDEALDAALAARGYAKIDPVMGYAAPVSAFAPPQRHISAATRHGSQLPYSGRGEFVLYLPLPYFIDSATTSSARSMPFNIHGHHIPAVVKDIG